MRKIIFYSESKALGGHEKMALAAYAAIQRRYENLRIDWMVSERNGELTDALQKAGLGYKTLIDAPVGSLRRNPLRVLWKIFKNAAKLRQLSPDLVMIVQGNIFLSYGGILSSLIVRLRYCSYIPMMFRTAEVKRHRFRIAAKLLLPILYKTIPSYITIDEEQAGMIRRENRNASVVVVSNYIPESTLADTRPNARAALGIPNGRKVLSVIGRILFSHKCQDWVIQELKNDPFMVDKFVLFVGDGPDACALRSMLTTELRGRFGLVGWRSDLHAVYAATDVLLIPSKTEGVPLVMLEALGYKIPVVGSDQDGMRSWLPEQWRFTWGDANGLKRGIHQALSVATPELWAGITKRLAEVHDEDRFAFQFSHALRQFCEE
jgi:glycosyltransferase involved in cell wall biosynthesis